MTYRDDRDALRDQIRRLEQRAQDAEHEVALLRGDASSSAVDSVGALRPLALDRVVPRPLSERRAADLERMWRARLPAGMRVERNGLRVTADSPGLSMVAEADAGGGARLRMTEDARPLRRVWALIALSITLTLGSVAPLALRASGPTSVLAAIAALFAIAALPLGAWAARRRRRELARTFEASAFVLSEHEARSARTRVVPAPDETEQEARAVDENEQAEDELHARTGR